MISNEYNKYRLEEHFAFVCATLRFIAVCGECSRLMRGTNLAQGWFNAVADLVPVQNDPSAHYSKLTSKT